jgi:hypothetical protein
LFRPERGEHGRIGLKLWPKQIYCSLIRPPNGAPAIDQKRRPSRAFQQKNCVGLYSVYRHRVTLYRFGQLSQSEIPSFGEQVCCRFIRAEDWTPWLHLRGASVKTTTIVSNSGAVQKMDTRPRPRSAPELLSATFISQCRTG